jgi:hypothetical protein
MSHAGPHVRLASVRLAAALVLAWWTAMRGGSLLGLRAEHIQVLDDASNSLLKFTMCVWLPTQKNDVGGAKGGAWFPLTPNARDAYLCPALWTAIWLDLNADAYVAAACTRVARAASARVDASLPFHRELLRSALARCGGGSAGAAAPGMGAVLLPPPPRSFSAARGLPAQSDMSSMSGSFLFSAVGDVSRPWSKSAAGSALTVAVTAALGPGVRATLHSARQSFLTRAAIAGLAQSAASTWGGWEGHDVLHYARQDLDAMLVVGRQLAGVTVDAPDIILPYGARWAMTGALPPAHGFDRVLCAARRTIEPRVARATRRRRPPRDDAQVVRGPRGAGRRL